MGAARGLDRLEGFSDALFAIALTSLHSCGADRSIQPKTHSSMPVWIQRLLIALLVGGYFYYVILPWIFKRLREIGNPRLSQRHPVPIFSKVVSFEWRMPYD
jgi:hypothetical protein